MGWVYCRASGIWRDHGLFISRIYLRLLPFRGTDFTGSHRDDNYYNPRRHDFVNRKFLVKVKFQYSRSCKVFHINPIELYGILLSIKLPICFSMSFSVFGDNRLKPLQNFHVPLYNPYTSSSIHNRAPQKNPACQAWLACGY